MIRDATPADAGTILALNLESEALMSPMDAARYAELGAMAGYLRVLEERAGFHEIGSQWLANGKQVSFQEALLD